MNEKPSRHNKEDIKELLQQYKNFKAGKKFRFIEEDAFLRIIDYFDEIEDMASALEAANYGAEQFPYSAALLIKKADVLLAIRKANT